MRSVKIIVLYQNRISASDSELMSALGMRLFYAYKQLIHFFDKSLRRHVESVRETENHIQRRCTDAFFETRNIAALEAAKTCQIGLTPSSANTSPDDDAGKTGT